MLPFLNAEQMRTLDAHTTENEPITTLELMERAASRCAQWILERTREGRFGPPQETTFLVLSGMGNNGGDGLVIARLLHASGFFVRVFRYEHRSQASADNASNWDRLDDILIERVSSPDVKTALEIRSTDVVIDALFGTGLSGRVTDQVAQLIQWVAESGRPVVAVDLPSGLFAEDNTNNDPEGIVRASYTLTFEFPKLALVLPENEAFVGAWEVLPIGSDHDFAASLATPYRILQEADILPLLRPRPHFGHKGTFGHALIIAGSTSKAGAAVLATRGALRSGVGLVTAHVPKAALDILQICCPEAMCSTAPSGSIVDSLPKPSLATAIGIGPGLGSAPDTALVLKSSIQEREAPLVLDADALNILSDNRTWRAFLPPDTILTPHPKEFDRLHGAPAVNGYQRLGRARQMAKDLGVIVVLKGAWTAICSPDGAVFFNSTGNPGMAKGGSGDVLTGLLTGLRAQGYGPLKAAVLGVFLHGLAGDIAARHKGMDAMIAGDLVEALPEAWKQLRNASFEGQAHQDI